ncbi:MAG TPA: hypothetical protein VEA41_10410 [Salinarimonas sp.]|nr:hypothetical protein [Salinarimonas sp.]
MADAAHRIYTVVFDDQQIGAAAQDLLAIYPDANKPFKLALIGLYLSNTDGATVAGDANEQFPRWSIIRGNTTPGSGGTAPTPTPTDEDYAPASFTARVNDTTLASGGTPKTLHCEGFNSRTGIIFPAHRLARPKVRASGGSLVVRLLEALPTPVRCSMTAYIAEYEGKSFDVLPY